MYVRMYIVSPTYPGAWMWESVEYYEAKTMQAVKEVLYRKGVGAAGKGKGKTVVPVPFQEIEKEVSIPPPLKGE